MQRIAVLALMLVAARAIAAEPSAPAEILLSTPPSCVSERLGRITVKLGTEAPNPRTGMAPPPVSYQKAFEKLQKVASERGGEAVVLRGHEAHYYTKGARIARRPTYLELGGDVVNLKAHGEGCTIVYLDTDRFEQEALAREGDKVTLINGMAY